jgi:holo-[acyl-carrier protein] synthase
MIIGIGTDIVEVERVASKIRKKEFVEKVFSKSEIEYCESMQDKAQHYAARFSAKEAFLKASGKGLQFTHDLNEIEITQTAEGAPKLKLTGKLASHYLQENWVIHVSLSHVAKMACATVVIESIK